jgi:hypothetical protein
MADYNLGTAHGKIEIDADTSGVDETQRALQGLGKDTDETGKKLEGLDKSARVAVKGLNVVRSTLIMLGTKAALGAVAVGALTGMAQQMSGVLGLIPAVAVGGGLALGALALGFRGFGDAMKNAGDPEAFAEALKTLSPHARGAAIALRDLAGPWKDLQQNVQDHLFANTGDRISALGNTYLPMLKSALVNVADSFNTAFHQIADIFSTAQRQADMRLILGATSAAVGNLIAAFPPLVSAFLDIAAVGAPIFRDLTASVAPLATRFAEFIAKARESGQLAAWMQTGIQAFRDLWTIVGLLIGTVTNLVAALGGPDTLMGILLLVAQALNTLSLFIQQNISWLGPLAMAIGTVVLVYRVWSLALAAHAAVTSFWATSLFASHMRALAGLALTATQMAAHYARMVVAGAAWVATAVAQIAVIIYQWALMAAQATLHALRVAAAWLLTAGANAIAAGAATAAAGARIVAAWALMAAQSMMHALRVAAAWLITTGASMVTALAQMAVAAAWYVAQWVIMAVGAMARAAIMAAAWFVALGPVGWVIAVIIALVALIIANWDKVVAWTKAAWTATVQFIQQAWQWIQQTTSAAINAVSNAISAGWNWVTSTTSNAWNAVVSVLQNAWNWIQQTVSSALNAVVNAISAGWNAVTSATSGAWNAIVSAIQSAWNWIQSVASSGISYVSGVISNGWNWIVNTASSAWNAIVNAVASGVNNVMSLVASLPGRIMGAIGNLGGMLVGVGRNLVIGLWNGIAGAGGWLLGMVRSWASSIVNSIKSFFRIGSPSKLFRDEVGKMLPAGLAIGINANADQALKAASALGGGVMKSVGMSAGGPEKFWEDRPLGPKYVPPSREVSSYGDAQQESAAAAGAEAQKIVNFNTYNPVAERASDSEARRLRALSALGAF